MLDKEKTTYRDEIIFWISIGSNYSEEYLKKLSDEELLTTYERLRNKKF